MAQLRDTCEGGLRRTLTMKAWVGHEAGLHLGRFMRTIVVEH